jgi:arylformamidase
MVFQALAAPRRRRILKGGLGLAAMLLADHAAAAPVFAGLSQEDLDRAYDQDVWAPNAREVQGRFIASSAQVARTTPPLSRRYGPGDKQFVDIFAPPGARNAAVFVLIHGGAWRLAMREAYYGPAPAILAAGGVLAVVGFQCLPTVTLPQMADQIRHALVWIGARIGEFGGDSQSLHLIGHSSGGHLAGVMLTTDWVGRGLPTPALRSATLISGLYDLYPAVLSSRGQYMHLDSEEVVALSPMRHLDRFAGSAVVAWGSKESPEFQRQSRVLAEALQGMGRLDDEMAIDGRNHYEVFEALSDPCSSLTLAMLARAGLGVV